MSASADDRSRLRFTIVAMPWSRRDRPSAALAALSAYVRARCPQIETHCRSEFVELSERIGRELYDELSVNAYRMGEMMYTCLLYPEKVQDVRNYFVEWSAEALAGKRVVATEDFGKVFDETRQHLEHHLETVAEELTLSADVIGLTTCFGQLFANLALAKALKRRAPGCITLLGGSTVSSSVGPSILGEYDFVDYVIQGEGEQPLAALLNALDLAEGEGVPALAGVLSRATAVQQPRGAKLWEVSDLNALPPPDYDEYAGRAEQYGIEWYLPLEASRGCWWDRTRRTGDPKNTCYFCNLNVQWMGYREKSAERVCAEMEALSNRHKNLKIYFVDNIIRHKGVQELASGIRALGKDFEIFYEMRANIRPIEILQMKEAGLSSTQFGIEALSSSVLRRIGKGTSVIQNLQAMRLCLELGIENMANLILDFPGSTPEEVAETCEVLNAYALSFHPLSLTGFTLGIDSTVDVLRNEYRLQRIRNADHYRHGIPEAVLGRLQLFDRDYDLSQAGTDWTPVREACKAWRKLHADHRGAPLLRYRDGGSFLIVDDERHGELRSGVFEGVEREVYLFAMERRTRAQIARRFQGRADPVRLDAILAQFLEYKIMYSEKEEWLSLAVAVTPEVAARRIRATVAEEAEERAASALPQAAVG